MKYFYKVSTGKTHINFRPVGEDVIEAPKPPNRFSRLKYSEKNQSVEWVEDKALKAEQEKQEALAEVSDFGRAVLDFFLARMFTLTTDQQVKLQSVKVYFDRYGTFPPLADLGKADPALVGMIQDAIAAGELPALPKALQ